MNKEIQHKKLKCGTEESWGELNSHNQHDASTTLLAWFSSRWDVGFHSILWFPAIRAFGLAFILTLFNAGCSTQITVPTNVVQPQAVFVLDYGRHSSLLLPNSSDTAFREFAYGEWQWYAQKKDGFLRTIPVLFLPTEGTIGRNEWAIEGAQTEQDTEGRHHQIGVAIWGQFPGLESVYTFHAERDAIAQLWDELNTRFESSDSEPVHVAEYHLYFVPDSVDYTLFHNCNHEVVAWMEALGCIARGSGTYADFVFQGDEDLEIPPPDSTIVE